MFRRLNSNDRGVGLVTALAIAFVVLTLGSVWVATSFHELDETEYNEHRTAALNSAEAGARWAMAALAQDLEGTGWIGVDASSNNTTDLTGVGLRTALTSSDYVASGTGGSGLGGTCLTRPHLVSANGDQLGEWWARVWPIDPAEYLYQIESWGWSPETDARQAANQKVTVQVRLVPDFEGFTNALFAEANLSGLNRKEIYGDVYSGQTADISNFTRIFPNDAGYIGEGRLRVRGDLLISSGSNNEFSGPVDVQGIVRDDKSGTAYADLNVRNDESVESATSYSGQSYVRNASVTGEASFDAKWGGATPGYTGSISGTVVDPVNDLNEVPAIPLPTFSWAKTKANLPAGFSVTEHASAADFQSWFSANKGALSGAHYVPEATGLDFRSGAELAGDAIFVIDGDTPVQGTPSVAASADTPVDLIIVQEDPAGLLSTQNKVTGSDGVLHHLLFSNGQFDAANQTTVYGAVYGYEDVSTNRLEIHFRPPDGALVKGFDFTVPNPDSFTPQPLVWRSVPVSEPTPITDYCGVEGGAPASVPAPSPTSSTTTIPTTTTTSGSTGPTTTTLAPSTTTTTVVTCVTLPNGKCKKNK